MENEQEQRDASKLEVLAGFVAQNHRTLKECDERTPADFKTFTNDQHGYVFEERFSVRAADVATGTIIGDTLRMRLLKSAELVREVTFDQLYRADDGRVIETGRKTTAYITTEAGRAALLRVT